MATPHIEHQAKVWTSAENAPALAGAPQAKILEPVSRG